MRIDNIQELGELIRKTRKDQGLSQKDLALIAGTSLRLVIELESGKRNVHVDTVIKICKLLGLTVDIG